MAPVLVASLLLAASLAQEPKTVCPDTVEWEPPTTIWTSKRGSPSAPTSAFWSGDTLYLFAQAISLEAKGAVPAPDDPIALLIPPGDQRQVIPVASPSGTFAFGYPEGGVDARGRLQIIWGEYGPPGSPPSSPHRTASSLWTATRFKGHWTKPRQLAKADMIYWSGQDNSELLRDDKGDLHAIVPTARFSDVPAIFHASTSDTGWLLQEIRVRHEGVQTAAVMDGSHILVTLVGSIPGQGSDVNSVSWLASVNLGQRWDTSRVVSKSGSNGALDPRLATDAHGVVHLFWGQSVTPGLTAALIRHVASSDLGAKWSGASDLRAPSGDVRVRSVRNVKDGFFVLYSPADRFRLAGATWCAGTWKDQGQLFSSALALDAGLLSRRPDGRLALIWATVDDSVRSHPRSSRWLMSVSR